MSAVLKLTPETDAVSIAQECLRIAEDDPKRATRLFVERIQNDERLFRIVMTPLIQEAARKEIRLLSPPKPRRVYTKLEEGDEPQTILPTLPMGVMAVAQKNWLEYPLFNGLSLGEAGSEQLSLASDMHQKQSKQYAAKARLFTTLAAKLPQGKRVRDAFTHTDIQRLSIQVA